MQTAQTPPAASRFPLRVSDDRRRIVDASGTPVLFQGDAAWSLIANTTLAEAERYLRDRHAKGFNAVIVNLIEARFAADAPRNRAGVAPFTTPGDFRTPNEDYMEHAHRVLETAADLGIVVFLHPAYLGYPYAEGRGHPEGWYEEVLANGEAGCSAWGAYLGRRFGDLPNLIWSLGGDRNPGEATAPLGAIAHALRESGVTNLLTSHVLEECSPLDLPGVDWVDVNLTYSYTIVHRVLRADWERQPTYPFLLIESTYEGEWNASDLQIRRQAYWSVLCGGNGHCMGNRPIWLFDDGWPAAMDGPGSVALMHWGRFFRALPWADLVPDVPDTILVGGLGEARGLDRATTAATADRTLAVAYLPSRREVVVDPAALGGRALEVEWFDPASGQRRPGDPLRGRGPAPLTPPFPGDSVLTLRARR